MRGPEAAATPSIHSSTDDRGDDHASRRPRSTSEGLVALAATSIRRSSRSLQDRRRRLSRPSPTFSAYRGYSWFRDGAFIADALSAGGASRLGRRPFFDWCARMLIERDGLRSTQIVAAAEAGAPLPDADDAPDPLHLRRRARATTTGGTSSSTATAPGSGPSSSTPTASGETLDRWRDAIELVAPSITS